VPEVTMVEAIRQALDEELERDERVFILGNDVGAKGGLFGATMGLQEKYGEQRVIDSPLSPAALVGAGIGAALYGLMPVCEIQFGGYIYPAMNQIVNEAARIHYRSCGEWRVPVVIRAAYGGGTGGGLYQSQSVEAFFTQVPGLKVVIPSSPEDAKGLLKSAICDPNPVLFLEPVRGYTGVAGVVTEGTYTIPLGKAKVTRQGTAMTVIAYGMMHQLALKAAEKTAQEGIDVEVLDLRTLYPVDQETIISSVRKTNRALIVYEDNLTGGYGAEIAALIAEHAFQELDAPVKRLAGPDVPGVPFSYPMQEWFMLNVEKIAAVVRELNAY
jgi:2-oxoisovalerate dehydrogenase E1 component beta subunit